MQFFYTEFCRSRTCDPGRDCGSCTGRQLRGWYVFVTSRIYAEFVLDRPIGVSHRGQITASLETL